MLLSLIAVLLIVMTMLIPDAREAGVNGGARSEPAEGGDSPVVGIPDPAWEDEEPWDDAVEPHQDREDPGESPDGALGRQPDPAEPLPDRDDPDEVVRPQPEEPSAVRGTVYFVLDDVGYSVSELEPFLELDVPMTISVLPHLEHSGETAERSRSAGRDVILHLPMEPLADVDPGPGAVLTGHPDSEIRRRIRRALESVPGAIGANNHMGSAATADTRVMRTVISELASHDLFFLDSRTTADTTVSLVSGSMALPYIARDIFVDHRRDASAMREALDRAIDRAAERGTAIAIGHVQTPELPGILADAEREARRRGVRFAGLSHYRDQVFLADESTLDGR